MKALFESKMRFNDTARSKMVAQPQLENMDDFAKRKARGWIRRCKRTAEGEWKAASLSEASLDQVEKLRSNPALNAALLWLERTTVRGAMEQN